MSFFRYRVEYRFHKQQLDYIEQILQRNPELDCPSQVVRAAINHFFNCHHKSNEDVVGEASDL